MKRFTAILLTGIMIFSLTSCGKKPQEAKDTAVEKVEAHTQATEQIEESETKPQETETQATEAKQPETQTAETQTAEPQQPENQADNSAQQSEYQYTDKASYENGESVSLNPSWQYADHSAINSGSAVMYKATANRKNIVVGVNAGHGTSGGTSVKTLCYVI